MFLAKKKRNRNLIALRKKLAMEWTRDQLLWFSLSKKQRKQQLSKTSWPTRGYRGATKLS